MGRRSSLLPCISDICSTHQQQAIHHPTHCGAWWADDRLFAASKERRARRPGTGGVMAVARSSWVFLQNVNTDKNANTDENFSLTLLGGHSKYVTAVAWNDDGTILVCETLNRPRPTPCNVCVLCCRPPRQRIRLCVCGTCIRFLSAGGSGCVFSGVQSTGACRFRLLLRAARSSSC